jgi:hypothetical protein
MNKKLPKARSVSPVKCGEILAEYDFGHAMPNKYAARYAELQETSESKLQDRIQDKLKGRGDETH